MQRLASIDIVALDKVLPMFMHLLHFMYIFQLGNTIKIAYHFFKNIACMNAFDVCIIDMHSMTFIVYTNTDMWCILSNMYYCISISEQ